MSGIVLLDEAQQRSLFNEQPQPRPDRPREPPVVNNRIRTESRLFQPARPPPPATPPSGIRTDFTTNEGLPRTDLTAHTSTGKRSFNTNGSHSSSFATEGGTHDTTRMDTHAARGLGGDSYPMLRDDHESSNESSSDNERDAAQYAGTSSGLKISVRLILLGVALGLAFGIMCSRVEVSPLVAQWIRLPGDLFLRALKCLVVPYVFCSVAVAIGDIVFVGKVSVVGRQTAMIFFVFWLATVTLGVAVALIFRPLFRMNRAHNIVPVNSISFVCANNSTLSISTHGGLVCSGDASSAPSNSSAFVLDDVNDAFQMNAQRVIAQLNLSEQIMQMIIPIISKNIFTSLANSELLSIITFAMVFGAIAGRSYFTKTRRTNYLYLTLLQLRNTLFLMMEWTIWLSPIAVISIIAGSFATNQESLRQFGDAVMYPVAALVASLLQILVVYPLIVFLMTRCNPYSHMKQMIRAYAFAFACSSSLATAPVTLTCIRKAKVCSQSLANFVVSIGVSSNISGMGIYTPVALVFLAESSGNGDQITWIRVVGIFVLSLLSCSGTPPIPASGLVVISTAYTTLFGEIPSTFSYVVAADFILDRFSTTCNVNDDIMALKIIAENTDETVAQDHLGERF